MATPSLLANGLLAALTVLFLSAGSDARPEPEPGRLMDFVNKLDTVKLPHPSEYLTLSPQTMGKVKKNFMVVKNCLSGHLKHLPGAVVQSAMVCVPTAPAGVAAYAACVAGKGLIDAAKATNQIVTCANEADKGKDDCHPPHGPPNHPQGPPHHGPQPPCHPPPHPPHKG